MGSRMLSGVGVICFSASYAVALALEVSRLVFRSGVRGALLVGVTAAGWVAHTAFLYYQAVRASGSPLSSPRDWYLVAAWLLVPVYLYLTCYHRRAAFGLFLLPAVLALIGVAVGLASPEPNARGPASAAWGLLHGGSIVLATVALLVGFLAGLMYLVQAWRLKDPARPIRRLRLPSLEWLARANSRSIVLATLTLAIGVFSGLVLVHQNPESRVGWSDPFVWSTWAALAWLVGTVAVEAFYRPARAGRKVVYLTLASFAVLAAALALGLLLKTQHGGGPGEAPSRLNQRVPWAACPPLPSNTQGSRTTRADKPPMAPGGNRAPGGDVPGYAPSNTEGRA
ncbi:MAG: cytochrome c biogenesis protein CcsA [Pirellulales bacterium]|nr:cytochrome c biogenesis protein CcsA [Pirellulales bacterium]